MRYILFGVGAVGGVVAAALIRAGQDVVGIARGARLDALRENGLCLHSPNGVETFDLECVGSPGDVEFRADDRILLLVKGQHTHAALEDLKAAGVTNQPIFCCQNGVANEAAVAKVFENVHAVVVMLPCEYIDPKVTIAFCAPMFGMFDIGCYPDGADDADNALAEALTAGGIAGYVAPDVMQSKYGKLLMNLGNIANATLGRGEGTKVVTDAMRAEGRAVLQAAGITWRNVGQSDPRRAQMSRATIEGAKDLGGSTAQSLARGTGSVETEFLNGEIVRLGECYGIATPVNRYFLELSATAAREKLPPGSLDFETISAELGI